MIGETGILLAVVLGALVATGVLVARIVPFYRASMTKTDARELIATVLQLVIAEVGIQSFWIAALLIPEALRDPPGVVRYAILIGFVGTTWAPVVVLYRLYGRIFAPKK